MMEIPGARDEHKEHGEEKSVPKSKRDWGVSGGSWISPERRRGSLSTEQQRGILGSRQTGQRPNSQSPGGMQCGREDKTGMVMVRPFTTALTILCGHHLRTYQLICVLLQGSDYIWPSSVNLQ